jgi:hypothetical protein
LPLLKEYPEFDETPGQFPGNTNIYCRNWCPQSPEVNKVVFALVDEVVNAFETDAFHAAPDKGLDETCQRGEILSMKTGRALVLIAMLAVQAICVLGASYSSWPNPIGEAVYRPHLLRDMLPIAVIVCGLSVTWLLLRIRRKAKKLAPEQAESHRD